MEAKTFTRLVAHKEFKSLIKEARRVYYIVEGEENDFYQVKDDQTNALVFAGIKTNTNMWLATFSTAYWRPPEV